MTTSDIDKFFSYVGVLGRYQKEQWLWFTYCMVGVAYPILIYIFAVYRPPFSCSLPVNDVLPIKYRNESDLRFVSSTCEIKVERNLTNKTELVTTLPCLNGYQYDIKADSVITEWNLVCSNEGKGELTQSLTVIGQGVGALFVLPLADKYGRKKIYTITGCLLFLATTLTSLSVNYNMYVVMKFLSGIVLEGFGIVFYTFLLEMLPSKQRGYVGIYGAFLWTTNVMSLTIFGYTLQSYSWRYLHLATGLVSTGNLVLYWFCDESPRWLIANGKIQETVKVIRKIAKKNGKDPEVVVQLLLNPTESTLNQDEGYEEDPQLDKHGAKIGNVTVIEEEHELMRSYGPSIGESTSLLTIIMNSMLRRITLVWFFIWFTNSSTYYGLLLASVQMKGSRFLNFFVNGAVEIPANIVFWILLNRVERRKLLAGFSLLGGIPMIASAIFIYFKEKNEAFEMAAMVCSFIAKTGISGSYNTIFVYLPETYPTNFRYLVAAILTSMLSLHPAFGQRNLGFGLASAASHIGGIVAPFSTLLVFHVPWAPGLIFGSCCLVMAVLVLFLPETRNRPLPQTIEEMDSWSY